MREFEGVIRPEFPDGVDHAPAHPASAVNGQAGGFVQDQKIRIFVNDGRLKLAQCTGRYVDPGAAGDPGRRNAHLVARLEPPRRSGAAAIDPHLPRPDQPVNGRSGQTVQISGEEVVETLVRPLAADGDRTYAIIDMLTYHEQPTH